MNDIGLMLADKEDYFIDGFGLVPPITVKDFIYMGDNYEKKYEDLLFPWRLCIRSFYTESEYNSLIDLTDDLRDFDMFFLPFEDGSRLSIDWNSNEKVEILEILIDSIKFIFKVDEVEIDYKYGRLFFGEYEINRLNYEDVCNVILKTNMCEKSKKEEPKVFENDRQRDIYNKLQEGRKRKNEKCKLGIKQILNIVMVYTKYQINDVLKNMTIYQLFNTYSSLSVEDGYKLNLTWIPVVADIKKLDLEHWSTKLKREV